MTRAALKKGIPVIAANKGPLALAYQDETQLVVLPEKRALELAAPNLNRIQI